MDEHDKNEQTAGGQERLSDPADSSFMERVVEDARATGRTASLLMSIRHLEGQKEERLQKLDDLFLAIGRNAEELCEWLVSQQEVGRDDAVALTGGELQNAKESRAKAKSLVAERDSELKAAQDHLAEEEKKHADIIGNMESRYRDRQDELKRRQDEVTKIRRTISSIQAEIKKLQTRIEKAREAETTDEPVDALTAQKAEREQSLKEPNAQLELANEKRSSAKGAVDARNAELKEARGNWKKLRAELADNVRSARAVQAQALEDLQVVEKDLRVARKKHGKALFGSGDVPEDCKDLAEQAQAIVDAIEAINTEIAGKRSVIRKQRGGAKRFAVLACVIVVAFVGGFLLGLWSSRARPVLDDKVISAAKVGDVSEMKNLLARNGPVNARDKDNRTPLHWAANKGHKAVVELLIANGADVNAREKAGKTSLHAAAIGGHRDVTDLLITHGADVNAKDQENMTPLHNAAYKGHKAVAELLIANGADVNAKNKKGDTPLRVAVERSHGDLVKLLQEQSPKE